MNSRVDGTLRVQRSREARARSALTVVLRAAGHQFPEHQAHGVHVYPQERVPLEVNGPLQDLRGHVAPGSHLGESNGQGKTMRRTDYCFFIRFEFLQKQ